MMHIIYYNDRYTEWFQYALESVKRHNPNMCLHLLTPTIGTADTCRWFEDNYVHKSTNPRYFETACIRRWIVINDYVIKNKIDRFLVLDWDILCFCDFDKELEKFKDYDFTYQNRISIGFSLWNNRTAMNDLVEIIRSVYCDQKSEVSKKILSWNGTDGGVCDMHMARELIDCGKYKSIDLYDVIDGVCFDNNMTITEDGWEAFTLPGGRQIKNIVFHDGIPYCKKNGIEVRMGVLHFASYTREMMKDYWVKNG